MLPHTCRRVGLLPHSLLVPINQVFFFVHTCVLHSVRSYVCHCIFFFFWHFFQARRNHFSENAGYTLRASKTKEPTKNTPKWMCLSSDFVSQTPISNQASTKATRSHQKTTIHHKKIQTRQPYLSLSLTISAQPKKCRQAPSNLNSSWRPSSSSILISQRPGKQYGL